MAADPKVINKIKKLLALGTSPNEHEAAAAMAKAAEIALAHDLEIAAIQGSLQSDPRSSIGETGPLELNRRGKPHGWRVDVFRAVAETFDCHSEVAGWQFDEATRRYTFGEFGVLIGRHADIEFADYAYAFLVAELQRLADEYGRARWQEIWDYAERRSITKHDAEKWWVQMGHHHPLRSKLSWLKGATQSVVERLREDKRVRVARTDATQALVVHKSHAIRAYQVWKRYGKTLEEYDAEVAKRRAEYRAAVVPAKPETPAQKRRREEREARESERWYQRYQRQQARIDRATDYAALQAGRDAGRQIAVRPGVKGGAKTGPAGLVEG